MVAKIQNEEQEQYQCEARGFHYRERELAEKCEQWCRAHNSCNLEITTHAEENKEGV